MPDHEDRLAQHQLALRLGRRPLLHEPALDRVPDGPARPGVPEPAADGPMKTTKHGHVQQEQRLLSSSGSVGNGDDHAERERGQPADQVRRRSRPRSAARRVRARPARLAGRRPAPSRSLRHARSLAAAAAALTVRRGEQRRTPGRHEHEGSPSRGSARRARSSPSRERPDRDQQERRGGERGQLRAPARGCSRPAPRRRQVGHHARRARRACARRAPRPSRCSSSSGVEPALARGLAQPLGGLVALGVGGEQAGVAHRRYWPWKPNGMWCGASARASSPKRAGVEHEQERAPGARVEHDREDASRRPRPPRPGARTKIGSPG